MIPAVGAVVGGLVLLAWAADQFVVGAARVALLRRVSALVVGVVIVGFGTSAPELLVSVLAAAGGELEVAVGNVVGSNVANLTLLLGTGAILTPIVVASGTVRREGLLVLAAVVAYGVAVQGGFSRLEGVLLAVGAAVALLLVVRATRTHPDDPVGPETEEFLEPTGRFGVEVVRTLAGLAGTILGAQLLVWGATDLAERADLSEGLVGATLVALGTSLPELVTVVQSARRREVDLIVGNLLGSNLFNALAVGGVAAIVGPGPLRAPDLTTTATLAMIGAAVLALVLLRTGYRLTRREGVTLVGVYVVVTVLLATT